MIETRMGQMFWGGRCRVGSRKERSSLSMGFWGFTPDICVKFHVKNYRLWCVMERKLISILADDLNVFAETELHRNFSSVCTTLTDDLGNLRVPNGLNDVYL